MLIVNDDKGNTWQLSALTTGQLTATPTGNRGPIVPTLFGDSLGTPVYELKIINDGQLAAFLRVGIPDAISLNLLTEQPGVFAALSIFAGIPRITLQNFNDAIVVGQIIVRDGSYPAPVQPGGIGTPVTSPVQTDGEKLGLWVAGCQHWFNHWDVHTCALSGVQSALICCPLCSYVQRIITPYSDIHTDANMIIFA